MLAKLRPNGGWRHWLTCLPRYYKRAALVLNDLAMLAFAVWASYSFRLNTFYLPPNGTVAMRDGNP